MKIYLSGKISGLTEKEYTENFEKAKHYVYFKYYSQIEDLIDIINPLKIKPLLGIKHWFFHMIADILKQRHCTHSAFQKNWIDSLGSVIEYIFAKFIFKQTIIFL